MRQLVRFLLSGLIFWAIALGSLQPAQGMAVADFTAATPPEALPETAIAPAPVAAGDRQGLIDLATAAPRYYTYPEFSNFITATVTTPASEVGEGLIFVASMGSFSPAQPGLLIVDDQGEPVYMQLMPRGMIVADFKVQTVAGVPYLVYHLGAPSFGWTNGSFYVLDSSYTLVDTWTISNGHGADLHDLQLLENGHALLFSYEPIPWDLSPYGGPADGVVIDIVVQEQDAAKNVLFEWRGSKHIPLTDTYASLTASPVDYMHTNAIALDWDGNLLLSNRNLQEVTKIDRQSGAVLWRLGGKANQFSFTNDAGFSYQHDIRRLPNGHITLFDNGNQHSPPHSRAVEYAIDEVNKTVTRVWQYPDDASRYSPFMGNVQRLSNGNTFIGWGSQPWLSEVTADGELALEMRLGGISYRAYRFPWEGLPAQPGRTAVAASGDPATATVYAAWNGATGISAYEIYAGADLDALSLLTVIPRTGFESSVTLSDLPPGICVFRARPLDAHGQALPFADPAYRADLPECRHFFEWMYFPLIQR